MNDASFIIANSIVYIHLLNMKDSPFKHRVEMSPWEWIRTCLFTITLFPLRVFLVMLLVLLYWIAASVTLMGHDDFPMTGWRIRIKKVGLIIGKMAFGCMGIIPTIVGKAAPPEEAALFVISPHSSFFDAFIVFWLGEVPSIVNREENRSIPLIGKCIRMTESLFVNREAPDSRQKIVQEIIRRTKDLEWPRLAIFPEGSTSNRKALMSFKRGAFVAGKPIQPVIIRYPNKVDTITWTWDQPHGAYSVVWLTLSQPYTRAIVEFLPVYKPTEDEKADPLLYGRNVRKVMAKSLGVPTCDENFHSFRNKGDREIKKTI